MRLSEFAIGAEFLMSGKRYRCTDVGQRTVTAIHIEPGRETSWYNGPPYAVAEISLDEHDQQGCEPCRD